MSDFKAPHSISAGAPPQTPLGTNSAPPDPLAGLRRPTSKPREERKGEGNEEGK